MRENDDKSTLHACMQEVCRRKTKGKMFVTRLNDLRLTQDNSEESTKIDRHTQWVSRLTVGVSRLTVGVSRLTVGVSRLIVGVSRRQGVCGQTMVDLMVRGKWRGQRQMMWSEANGVIRGKWRGQRQMVWSEANGVVRGKWCGPRQIRKW